MKLYLPILAISYMAVVCEKDVGFRVCTYSALYYHTAGVVGMVEQALGALKQMKAGLNAEKSRDKKKGKVRKEMSALYFSSTNKRKKLEQPQWKHKFMCLAYRDQVKIPTTDAEKDELFEAGLGEKEVAFDSVDVGPEEFREVLYQAFPQLRRGGGYQLFKCVANSRTLEPLSRMVYSSPQSLRTRVGNAKTYIRPIQRDLDLTPIEHIPGGVSLVTHLAHITFFWGNICTLPYDLLCCIPFYCMKPFKMKVLKCALFPIIRLVCYFFPQKVCFVICTGNSTLFIGSAGG